MSARAGGPRTLKWMSTLALFSRTQAALLVVASALAVVVTTALGSEPAALLTALAASAALAVVATVVVRDLVLAPAAASLRVGDRAREHRESLDRIAAPTHPDTAGRVRSRAPGEVIPAV